MGFAATSNIKQEKRHIIKDTQLQIADKGVVFKKVTNDGKDLRIPYDNIISFTAFTQKEGRKDKEFFELLLLENQSLFISLSEEIQSNTLKRVSQELVNIINSRATGKENEEEGWGLDYTNSKFSSDLKSEKITTKDISSTEELEKIVNMYEKGLLTDEEFAAMKKKIIEN